jgi:hypothetical protein
MPPLKNYDYDPEKVFYLNTYDYSCSNVLEKVLGPASEIYDRLVKGLTDLTISTTAGLESYSNPKNSNFAYCFEVINYNYNDHQGNIYFIVLICRGSTTDL